MVDMSRNNKRHPLCKIITAWWIHRGLPETFSKCFKTQLRHRLVEFCPESLESLSVVTDTMLIAAAKMLPKQCKPYEQVRKQILAKLG